MNWDDLRVFLKVAQLGSVTRAAQPLKMDPATVSRRLKRLEADLGGALFARSQRGLTLTNAGEQLLSRTEEVETLVQGLVPADRDQLQGTVRLGAPDGCANFLLPDVCAKLTEQHPDLVLDILPASRNFDLLRREVDLAIAVTEPESKRTTAEKVVDYSLVFAAAHDLIDRIGTRRIVDLPLTSYMPELLLDPGLDVPAPYRVKDPSLRSSSVMVQWQWICAGRAAGLVHDFAFPYADTIERLEPEFSIARQYYLVRRRKEGPLVSGVAKALAAAMREEVTRLQDAARLAWAQAAATSPD